MPDGLPTPRTTLRAAYVKLHVWCKACRHAADADLERLVSEGRGDTPLRELRFRCSNCRGSLTDFVVMSKDSAVVPWQNRDAARERNPTGPRHPHHC